MEKNRKRRHSGEEMKSVLHFTPQKIQPNRLKIMKENAERNGFNVVDTYSPTVTHIVTEFSHLSHLLAALKPLDMSSHTVAVKVQWLFDSIKAGKPLEATEKYQLKLDVQHEKPVPSSSSWRVEDYNCYACQRKSPLKHHNSKLVEALDVIRRHAEYRDDPTEHDEMRALAFYRAMAILRSLPAEVKKIEQVKKLKDIGAHSKKIIQEILEDGVSAEIEDIRHSQWFKSMEVLTSVFGAGPATAKKWFTAGYRTVDDVCNSTLVGEMRDQRLLYGLAFHDELSMPLIRADANRIVGIVKTQLESILPGTIVEMTGGFRRGKPSGHDVDMLISHPEEGAELGVLPRLCSRLADLGYLLYGTVQSSTYNPNVLKDTRDKSTLDYFEKWIGIFKLPAEGENRLLSSETETLPQAEIGSKKDFSTLRAVFNKTRSWRAVRTDLIVCPASQWSFALVGWTGNKYFNRSLRNMAKKERGMKLTSHGLWDYKLGRSLAARTEEDVFKHLQLEYLLPEDRNV